MTTVFITTMTVFVAATTVFMMYASGNSRQQRPSSWRKTAHLMTGSPFFPMKNRNLQPFTKDVFYR